MVNISKLRRNAGITQADISRVLKIDRSTVAKWETGKSRPRADKLPKLAKLLDCTIDELLLDPMPDERMRVAR
jgi:putative transcriptional regulator